MKLLDRIDEYLVDKEYKIIYKYKYLNIINYVEIIDFTDREIKIKYKGGVTKVFGINLVISKMLDDELVIIGDIERIEI